MKCSQFFFSPVPEKANEAASTFCDWASLSESWAVIAHCHPPPLSLLPFTHTLHLLTAPSLSAVITKQAVVSKHIVSVSLIGS